MPVLKTVLIRIAIVALFIWTLCCTIQSSSFLRMMMNNTLSSSILVIGENTTTNAAAVAAAASAPAGEDALKKQEEVPLPTPQMAGTVKIPKNRKIKQNQAVMLHIGKTGGGTFDLRSQQWWHVTIEKTCHPMPCLQASFYDIQNVNYTTVFISIRDPIDRFISAFYWRLQLWCRNDGTETRIVGRPAPKFPHLYCSIGTRPERQILFHKYQENANLLAESLCNDDNDNEKKNSNETMIQAAKDVRQIGHFASVNDWVDGPGWIQKHETLFPIVLEKNFSFETQIDDAMIFLQSRGRGGGGGIDVNPLDFQARQDYVHYMDQLVKQQQQQRQEQEIPSGITLTTTIKSEPSPETMSAVEMIQMVSHSSSSLNTKDAGDNKNNTIQNHHKNGIRIIPLSARGERCLARYYERDYQIIKDMSLYACKTLTCQHALQSIVNRRAHLLGWDTI